MSRCLRSSVSSPLGLGPFSGRCFLRESSKLCARKRPVAQATLGLTENAKRARIGAQLGSQSRGACRALRVLSVTRSERTRDSSIIGDFRVALSDEEQMDNRAMHAHMLTLPRFAITVQMRLVADDDVRARGVSRAGDREEALPVQQMSLS